MLGITRKTLLEKTQTIRPALTSLSDLSAQGSLIVPFAPPKFLGWTPHEKSASSCLGKTRREEVRARFLKIILGRIGRYAEIEITELREATTAALRKLKIEPSASTILLDAAGKQFTSQQFALWVADLRDRELA